MSFEHLKRTPLHEHHMSLNARMVPFGGWEMPVQYDGILNEHGYTRNQAAIFDISHMGEFIVTGNLASSGLDQIVTMRLNDLAVGSSRYGAILNEDGHVIDDLIVFRLEEDKWFCVVNGATTDKDAAHFQKNLKPETVFEDVSMKTGKIDIQGPSSRAILGEHVPGIDRLQYFSFGFFDLLGENVLISRTGYTGELGYEIFYPWEKTGDLWNELLKDNRVKPAGLGARDVLRIEKGYSLYGHELSESISILESGLGRFIDFGKDFIGKEALLQQKKQGVQRKLVGIESVSRRSPRQGQMIFSEEDEIIGEVTSGSFSPCVERGIGLGFISADQSAKGNTIFFGNEKQKTEARVTGRVFYKKGSLKD